MASEYFQNNAQTALSAAVDATTGTVPVTSVSGFPPVPFRTRVDDELMLVTAVSTSPMQFTVLTPRAQEGSVAALHAAGAVVTHVVTAETLRTWLAPYNPLPQSHHYLGWSSDPIAATQAAAGTAGRQYFIKLPLPSANVNITHLDFYIGTAAASWNGVGYAGLYTASGGLIWSSMDQNGAWQSAGLKALALSTALSGGVDAFCYASLLFTAGTGTPTLPQFARGSSLAGLYNANLPTSQLRFAELAGQTAMLSYGGVGAWPPGALAPASIAIWAAIG